MMLQPETDVIFADREARRGCRCHPRPVVDAGWFAALLILTSLLGFILALALFPLHLPQSPCRAEHRLRGALHRLRHRFHVLHGWTLNRDFPPGLLQEYVDLPWPLDMTQTAIPFLFMRGGTSRGPYHEPRRPAGDLERLAKF